MRFLNLFRKARIDREIDDELRFHLEMRVEDNLRAGMAPEAARQDAVRRFGNVTSVREQARDERGAGVVDVVLGDLRQGARWLRRRPGFAVTAVVTLALGIGASTAVFSVVDAVLLQPLPFPEPGQLVKLVEVHPQQPTGAVNAGNFLDWQRRARSFAALAAYRTRTYNLTGPTPADAPARVRAGVVTGAFFAVLGVPPRVGRRYRRQAHRPRRLELHGAGSGPRRGGVPRRQD